MQLVMLNIYAHQSIYCINCARTLIDCRLCSLLSLLQPSRVRRVERVKDTDVHLLFMSTPKQMFHSLRLIFLLRSSSQRRENFLAHSVGFTNFLTIRLNDFSSFLSRWSLWLWSCSKNFHLTALISRESFMASLASEVAERPDALVRVGGDILLYSDMKIFTRFLLKSFRSFGPQPCFSLRRL